MMTKKHFKKFAEACSLIVDDDQRNKVIEVMSAVCREDNPRFDQERFVEYIVRLINGDSLKGLR